MSSDRPRCQWCNKRLYRAKKKGVKVKKKDPYIYCRNEDCPLKEEKAKKKKPRRKSQEKNKPKSKKESKIVRITRKRVIKELERGVNLESYLLVTTIIAQELKIYDVSDILIDRFGLDETFGISKKRE